MQENTREYALEYNLCLLACFLGIDIYHVMIPMMIITTTIETHLIIITKYLHIKGRIHKTTHTNI